MRARIAALVILMVRDDPKSAFAGASCVTFTRFGICYLKRQRYARFVNGKWSKLLPYIFMLLAALSRWPGLFPPNFSAFYALAFCAGAFFPRQIKWWLPLGTLVVSDLALNLYYLFGLGINSFKPTQLVN